MLALLGRNGLILLSLLCATPLQAAFTVTTMNIEFYGSHTPTAQRDQAINQYLDQNDLRSDVMVFQEIVDVSRLQANITGFPYKCQSYESTAQGHQHVVVCVKSWLRFEKAVDDDDFVLENIAMGNARWRPAVHGILVDARSGRQIAHLVAVHLKAMPEDGEKRVQQMQMIHDYLAYERADELPAILVGDTNIFPDDVKAVEEVLEGTSLGLTAVETPGKYTYRVPEHGQKFDRYWIGPGLSVSGTPRVEGPCNKEGRAAETEIRAYNRTVSDHCAVAVKLKTR